MASLLRRHDGPSGFLPRTKGEGHRASGWLVTCARGCWRTSWYEELGSTLCVLEKNSKNGDCQPRGSLQRALRFVTKHMAWRRPLQCSREEGRKLLIRGARDLPFPSAEALEAVSLLLPSPSSGFYVACSGACTCPPHSPDKPPSPSPCLALALVSRASTEEQLAVVGPRQPARCPPSLTPHDPSGRNVFSGNHWLSMAERHA